MNNIYPIKNGTIKSASEKLSVPGYETIVVMTKSSKYGEIGPYVLKYYPDNNDDDMFTGISDNDKTIIKREGIVFENFYQFHKVYKYIPAVKATYSQWDNTVIWRCDEQTFLNDNNEIQDNYFEWRKNGFLCKYPIRYPESKKYASNCLFSFFKGEQLNYIESRKEIYLDCYIKALQGQRQFIELLDKLRAGKKLLIVEVDGPKIKDVAYYNATYNLALTNPIDATPHNLKILLNDSKNCFGHGYCLSIALLKILYPQEYNYHNW